ncbi:MAG: cell division protein FtsL [Candidatus Aminicenantes bacterium]|nr:cell division protein FtsL [Candidatus Aminicenantes bacterium]
MVRKKLNKKKVFLGIIGTLIVVFILTFYIWHQAESIRLGYQKGELEEKVLALQKEVEKLEAKKSSLLSLERVEKIAKEKLNLSEPKKDQIIYENASQRP